MAAMPSRPGNVNRKTETKVIDAVRELEKQKQRDSGKVRKAGRAWTVEKWLTHWVENIAAPSVRRNTLVGYRAAVYGHLIPGIGAHRIDKLQPEHLEALYRKLATKKGKHGKIPTRDHSSGTPNGPYRTR
jgi:hypothetical protein